MNREQEKMILYRKAVHQSQIKNKRKWEFDMYKITKIINHFTILKFYSISDEFILDKLSKSKEWIIQNIKEEFY